jgi:hypothetical protein
MWENEQRPMFVPERTVCFPLQADGEVHTYLIPLAANIHWSLSNTLLRLRLDPINYPGSFELYQLEFKSL